MARPERTDQVLVLGIDPGTAVTGYGVVARRGDGAVSLVECGVIRTSAGRPLAERIKEIYLEIDGDMIKDVGFQGSGCAISKASASLMTAGV